VTGAGELRVGVLGGGAVLTRWQRLTLQHLLAEPQVRLCGRVDDARGAGTDGAGGAGPGGVRGRVRRLAGALSRPDGWWELYADGWVGRRSRAAARVDARDLWDGVPVHATVPERRGRFSEHFDAETLEVLRSWRPDLLLRFGFGIIRGEILDVAPLGVWSFHHDDELVYRGSPPCFWEVARGDPLAAATLQRLTDRLDGGIVLAKAWFATVGGSYVATRDRVYLGSVDLPALVVRALRAGYRMPEAPSSTNAPVLRAPGRAELVRAGWRALRARRHDRRSPTDRRVELRLVPAAGSRPGSREPRGESPGESPSRPGESPSRPGESLGESPATPGESSAESPARWREPA